jgi:phage/plasmid primase-like uncharacterized protein
MTTDTRIDTERLCRRADLLGILGWSDKRQKAGTSGGEYAGACPFCGGSDRFICWPNHPERPACYCRREARQWDAIALVQELHQLDFLGACEYIERHAGIASPVISSGPSTTPKAATDDERRAQALRIWREAKPASNTIVETYLRSRAITRAVPLTIRSAPALWHSPSDSEHPALVAAVALAASPEPIAIMRIYLRPDGSRKADVEQNKMMLGRVGGGSVHLAPAGDTMAVGEGIESALSFMRASGLPTWAALSTSGMETLILPPMPLASVVVIGADNDANNAGMESAHRAAARWTAEGRSVRIALPPGGLNDWNDAMQEAARR